MKLVLAVTILASVQAEALSSGGVPKGLAKGSESGGLSAGSAQGSKPKTLTNIDIGNIRPENCVQGDGPDVYVGELYFGGVNKVNVFTGNVASVVPSFGYFGRGAAGLLPVDGFLFVAGGGTLLGQQPYFYVYDTTTGMQVAACPPPYNVTASLFNDLVVVGPKAYFTDSQYNALVVADVAAAKKGRCVLSSIPLPVDQFFDPNYKKLMANGIVSFGGGLVISNTNNGGLYFVDLKTLNVAQIASATDAPNTDGMRLAGNLLYAVENFNNRIAVWRLFRGKGGVTAVRQGYLNSSLYDTPTGAAIYDNWVFACNARFGNLGLVAPGEAFSNFTQRFNLIGVNRFDFE